MTKDTDNKNDQIAELVLKALFSFLNYMDYLEAGLGEIGKIQEPSEITKEIVVLLGTLHETYHDNMGVDTEAFGLAVAAGYLGSKEINTKTREVFRTLSIQNPLTAIQERENLLNKAKASAPTGENVH